ncbi:MAG: cation transporter, partial [Betaproteobacteria bacterium]
MIHGVSTPTPQQADDRRDAPQATVDSVEAALWIQGMHCAACSGLIEAAVQRVPGVQSIRVSASLHRAQVRWRPDVSSLPQIVQAIQAAGYGAEPTGVSDQGQVRAAERKQLLWQLFVAWFCAMQVMMLATPAYVAADGDMAP